MAFERYIVSDGKQLRCGYTTGTCAALAATAAASRLVHGCWPEAVTVMTPKGWEVSATPEQLHADDNTASCAIRKDGGDDVDATHGTPICAAVTLTQAAGIEIDGGEGVGRVTKPGLDQPVGNAAINSTPRRMIRESVERVFAEAGYRGGARIVISVPEGKEIAKKTFNPNLGIVGGISILGTSGIVIPMSLQAMSDSMKIELRQARAMGTERIILVPGNYGKDFLDASGWNTGSVPLVRISNFLGDALDECAALKFREVLLVGHIGKLVKLAGGIMNTHSRYADCRTELFCAHAAVCGASQELCRELLDSATTDACLELLKENNLMEIVMESLTNACIRHLNRRIAGAYRCELILFSNVFGVLGESGNVKELLELWESENSTESASAPETRS